MPKSSEFGGDLEISTSFDPFETTGASPDAARQLWAGPEQLATNLEVESKQVREKLQQKEVFLATNSLLAPDSTVFDISDNPETSEAPSGAARQPGTAPEHLVARSQVQSRPIEDKLQEEGVFLPPKAHLAADLPIFDQSGNYETSTALSEAARQPRTAPEHLDARSLVQSKHIEGQLQEKGVFLAKKHLFSS